MCLGFAPFADCLYTTTQLSFNIVRFAQTEQRQFYTRPYSLSLSALLGALPPRSGDRFLRFNLVGLADSNRQHGFSSFLWRATIIRN